MQTFKVLAALLDYPSAATIAALPEMRAVLAGEAALDGPAIDRLLLFIGRLEQGDLLDHQAAWVDLFDRTRSLSLHLFEHVHGDSRDRGQAMVDLGALYAARGLIIDRSELPDYLPLFLEFLSLVPEDEARALLGEAAHVVEALAERLAARGSDYAALLTAVADLAEGTAPAQPLSTPDADEDMDAAWEEAAVRFDAGAALAACTAGRPAARR